MKHPALRILFGLLSTLTAHAGTPQTDRHVVMVSIDGFPAWLWNDPALAVPRLRRLAAEGASARAMTVSNPSITWINHTTLVTGVSPRKHGVLFNGLLVRSGDFPPKLEQWAEKERMVFAPTLYDVAHEAGLTTAESDWVAVTRAKTIRWSFPEIPSSDGKVEREMIAAGAFSEEKIQWMQPGPGRKNVAWLDESWTRGAQFMLSTHRPNLLLHHILNTDAVHHTYGAGSMAGYTALAYADRLVGDLLDTVERCGLKEKTTVVVTTDHGFKRVSKLIRPNVILQREGLLQTRGTAITQWHAYTMAQGGIAFVYIRDPDGKRERLAQIKELFSKTEGISRVFTGEEAPALGMPTPGENNGMGDLILYAKAGYAFRHDVQPDEIISASGAYNGSHGYLSSDPDLDGICIFSGNKIRRGVQMDRMENRDVAPTLARILGLELPQAEGRILEEILLPEP